MTDQVRIEELMERVGRIAAELDDIRSELAELRSDALSEADEALDLAGETFMIGRESDDPGGAEDEAGLPEDNDALTADNVEEDGGIPDTPFHRLLPEVSRLTACLTEKQYLIPDDYTAFIGRIDSILAGISEDQAAAPKAMKIVADIVGFYSRIIADFASAKFSDLRQDVEECQAPFREFILAQGGALRPEGPAVGQTYAEDTHGGSVKRLFSSEADDTILAVLRHGLSGEHMPPVEPVYLIAVYTDDAVLKSLSRCYDVLLEYTARDLGPEALVKDIVRIRSWLLGLPREDKPADKALIYLRQALNIVSALEKRPKVMEDLIRDVLALLRDHGLTPIPAKIGGIFDGSFDSSLYERRYLRSEEPRDTIIRVIQIGLRDASGVPLQKAVVGVSKG